MFPPSKIAETFLEEARLYLEKSKAQPSPEAWVELLLFCPPDILEDCARKWRQADSLIAASRSEYDR